MDGIIVLLAVFGVIGAMVFVYTKYYLGLPTEIEQFLSSNKNLKRGTLRLITISLLFSMAWFLELTLFHTFLLIMTPMGIWTLAESVLLKLNKISYGEKYGWSALGTFLHGLGLISWPHTFKFLIESYEPTTLNMILYFTPIVLVIYGSMLSCRYEGLLNRFKQWKRFQKDRGV